jgi:hypothetical protein
MSTVDYLIRKAQAMPEVEDGEITPDVGRPKRPPQVQNPPRPKLAENLPAPQTVITPSGDRLRVVLAGIEHDQVFEASDYQELSAKLTKALTHANKFIDRLSAENTEMRHLITSISNYIASLSQLRGAEADEELQELTKIIHSRQSE